MKLLPHDAFTVVTADPPPIVLRRLTAIIEPVQLLRFSKNHALYQGSISAEGFQISRIIDYRNSFLPVISGRFERQLHGTAVHIQMSLHPFVMAFLPFWYLFWYGAIIPVTLTGAMPNRIIAVFFGMPVLALVFFYVAFWSEAKSNRRELTQIIQGDTVTICD